ncbi:MAG: putative immunity protein [Methanomassiliicoccales archaeon]
MAKSKFVDHPLSVEIDKLARSSDHRALAIWAVECAERVLPLFEKEFPEDKRPKLAIVKLREWIKTGEFHMAEVRETSLNAHAAARLAPESSAAQFAARACGQAMATAHVPTHSIAAAWYAAKAVWTAEPMNHNSITVELEWQYRRLLEIRDIDLDMHRLEQR